MESRANFYSFDYINTLHDNKNCRVVGNCMGCCVFNKINKSNFYKNKKIVEIEDIDINDILVSKKESYGTKIHINTLLDIMMILM